MRTCPECGKACRKYGEPRVIGVFRDQVIFCTEDGWCGVESEYVGEQKETVKQLEMF